MVQLILSGFGGENKELGLMRTVFQNLFPAIHVQTVSFDLQAVHFPTLLSAP